MPRAHRARRRSSLTATGKVVRRCVRELLDRHGLGPSDVAFAKRLRDDIELEDAVARWLEEKAHRPEDVGSSDWLDYEQRKHQKLLAA